MIEIWGRANSANVQKVLWTCDELGLEYRRIDAGMQHGRTKDRDYIAMNPNGLIPTLIDGEFVLWESNSIMRYLALEYGAGTSIYPAEPRVRACIDRWLDWTLSTLGPADRPVFWGLIRTPQAERQMSEIETAAKLLADKWRIVDEHLEGRSYAEGEQLSIGDIALGVHARRWYGVEGISKPRMYHVEKWYERLQKRDGFQRHVAAPIT